MIITKERPTHALEQIEKIINWRNAPEEYVREVLETLESFLCDVDGVLFDTEMFQLMATNHAFKKMGRSEISKEDYIKHFYGNSTTFIGKKVFAKDYSSTDLNKKVDEFLQIRAPYLQSLLRDNVVTPMKGLERFMNALWENDIITVLATGGSVQETEDKFAKVGLSYTIEGIPIVGHHQVKYGKPHPETFSTAADRSLVPIHNAYALEDTKSGTKSAYDAGVKEVLLLRNSWNKGKHFNYAHKSFNRLIDVMKYLKIV